MMTKPSFTNNYDNTYTVSNTCMCGRTTTARVPGSAVFAWNQGAFAQDAFSMLTEDQREAIFISGTCDVCWDDMFLDTFRF